MARLNLPRESKNVLSTTCDFCGDRPEVIVDAPTGQGPWAHMCKTCFQHYGVAGMGTTHKNVVRA